MKYFTPYRLGMCNIETKPGIFRRKSSNVSRSRLAPIQSSSCPTSPRQGLRKCSKSLEPAPSTSTSTAQPDVSTTTGLQRSASTISSYRPRSSPAGLYSYTGMVARLQQTITLSYCQYLTTNVLKRFTQSEFSPELRWKVIVNFCVEFHTVNFGKTAITISIVAPIFR